MKHFAAALLLALLFFVTSFPAQAKSTPEQKSIGQLVGALEEAYGARRLGQLDARHPFRGRVKIVIEHSLGEGSDQYEMKNVKTFEEAERWLRSREREDGTPFRDIRSLIGCKRSLCTYDFDGGILHNHLYIKEIRYGYRNGRPFIKSILLLDGD